MAGLIQEQMAPEAAQEALPQPQAMPGEMTTDEPDENDPAFQAALSIAMEALYAKKAAKDVAQGLQAAPSVVEGMANTAYEITSVVDERTDGAVPDELIVLLGISILTEVADIAEAVGLDVKPADVAEAFKQMLLRFLGEQGLDTTQLQQALDEVDPAMFEQAAAQSEEVA
jgi:hypothetical protein